MIIHDVTYYRAYTDPDYRLYRERFLDGVGSNPAKQILVCIGDKLVIEKYGNGKTTAFTFKDIVFSSFKPIKVINEQEFFAPLPPKKD